MSAKGTCGLWAHVERRDAAFTRTDRESLGTRAGRLLVDCLLFAITGCSDPTFTPIPENGLRFSVFGVLDASSDTQWVRVTPVRELVAPRAENDVFVTLTKLEGGETIALRDSVLEFLTPLRDSTTISVTNYWTAGAIEHGASYRLDVSRAGGPVETSATTRVAHTIEEVIVGLRNHDPDHGYLRVMVPDFLAMVHVLHYYVPGCPAREPYFVNPVGNIANDPLKEAPISTFVDPKLLECPTTGRIEIRVVVSGLEWVAGPGFGVEALGLPDLRTNVENGVGFLGGVTTVVVPWETCDFGPGSSSFLYCQIRYNGDSVTMFGRTKDAMCDRGISRAVVQMREIEPAGALPRIRTVSSVAGGTYRIGGLEPGRPYERQVSHPDRWPPPPNIPEVDYYATRVDTVTFEPGAEVEADLPLERTRGANGLPVGGSCPFL